MSRLGAFGNAGSQIYLSGLSTARVMAANPLQRDALDTKEGRPGAALIGWEAGRRDGQKAARCVTHLVLLDPQAGSVAGFHDPKPTAGSPS